MQTLHHSTPFATDSHVQAASKLSSTESKLLSSVKSELDRINQLAVRCRGINMGRGHSLDEEIHEATLQLMETATEEAAELVHNLMVRRRDSDISADVISAATQVAGRREIEKLTPLAVRILTDAESAFLSEADAHRAATKTSTTFASTTSEFDSRVEATKAAFEAKRRWITQEGAAGHYLMLELGLTA